MCGDSPQPWCQQQTEGGDTENQQVHLSRERRTNSRDKLYNESVLYGLLYNMCILCMDCILS